MPYQKFLFPVLFLIMALMPVSAQISLESYGEQILSPMFDSSKEKDFSKIIETYEDLGVSRVWIFDKSGRVSKELDFRESGFSASTNGELLGSAKSNFNESLFTYNSSDEIEEIHSTIVLNGDTLKTKIEQQRFENKILKKTAPVRLNEFMEKEFLSTVYLTNGMKDSTVTISTTSGKKLKYEHKSKTIFHYQPDGLLHQEFYYYFISDLFEEEKIDKEEYRLSSIRNYVYDEKERLCRVEDLEIDKHGKQIPNSVLTYEYFEDSNRIKGIKIDYYDSGVPEHADMSVEYDEKGNPSQLKTDFRNVHYKYEYKG